MGTYTFANPFAKLDNKANHQKVPRAHLPAFPVMDQRSLYRLPPRQNLQSIWVAKAGFLPPTSGGDDGTSWFLIQAVSPPRHPHTLQRRTWTAPSLNLVPVFLLSPLLLVPTQFLNRKMEEGLSLLFHSQDPVLATAESQGYTGTPSGGWHPGG
jgi:hypothetical protein